MGCGSEKALKANVPNSHPGLLLRTLEYQLNFSIKQVVNEFQASAHMMTLPAIIDRLSSLDRRGLAIFEESFCNVGWQGVQLDIW